MPATDKSGLKAVTEKEYGKLVTLLAKVEDDVALQKDDEDTSIKDVIAHRAHWIDLFLGWYFDGLAGKTVHFPAEGYKWNELKRYNADLRASQAGLSWDDARTMLSANHKKLLSLIESLTEGQLYGGPMQGANNHWTVGRWAEAAGPSHFRSAAKYIRGRLRDVG
ncbi:MAG: ClbS/DfsB family four-helix bundle protein [Rhodospirillales bacterium]|nr:ClbS/DfsB family four-helix bundle protein [Rhodospirillales bacterium]